MRRAVPRSSREQRCFHVSWRVTGRKAAPQRGTGEQLLPVSRQHWCSSAFPCFWVYPETGKSLQCPLWVTIELPNSLRHSQTLVLVPCAPEIKLTTEQGAPKFPSGRQRHRSNSAALLLFVALYYPKQLPNPNSPQIIILQQSGYSQGRNFVQNLPVTGTCWGNKEARGHLVLNVETDGFCRPASEGPMAGPEERMWSHFFFLWRKRHRKIARCFRIMMSRETKISISSGNATDAMVTYRTNTWNYFSSFFYESKQEDRDD